MILYKPQVLLVPSNDGNFFLHSTTFFDTINFEPKGYRVAKKLKKNGTLKVELHVVASNNFPSDVMKMKCINPVVHYVDLGDSVTVDKKGKLNCTIEAIIYFKSNARSGGGRRGGSTTVKSPTTGTRTRPNSNKA